MRLVRIAAPLALVLAAACSNGDPAAPTASDTGVRRNESTPPATVTNGTPTDPTNPTQPSDSTSTERGPNTIGSGH